MNLFIILEKLFKNRYFLHFLHKNDKNGHKNKCKFLITYNEKNMDKVSRE